MPALLRDVGQAFSPWMPGDEIQKQGISIGSGFVKFRKALHVVCPETENGVNMINIGDLLCQHLVQCTSKSFKF